MVADCTKTRVSLRDSVFWLTAATWFLCLGVLLLTGDKVSLEVDAVPCEADYFTQTLSKMVSRQQHWAKVRLYGLLASASFLLGLWL